MGIADSNKVGEGYVEVRADLNSVNQSLLKLKRDVDSKLKKAGESGGKNLMAGLGKAIGAIYALKKAWDFTKQAKDAKRDAIETESKFNTVFSSITKKANDMSDSFARSFGTASTTAKELLGDTGDLLVGFGFTEDSALDLSNQVNSLAQDLASFTNFEGGATGASKALTKAILGETEAVKALGIVLRQGTPEFKAQLQLTMQQEKVNINQARALILLKEAYKQSGKAVGDYARTKDDLANVERRADEELKTALETVGEKLTPIFLAGTVAVTGFLRAFTESEMDKAIRRLTELGIKAEDLNKIVSAKTVRENLSEIREMTEDIGVLTSKLKIKEYFQDPKFFQRFKKQMEFVGDHTISLERKQQRLGSETDVLRKLYMRLADQQAKGLDTTQTDELIDFHERVSARLEWVIGKYIKINQLKEENEKLTDPTVKTGDGSIKEEKERLGLIEKIEKRLEELDVIQPTIFNKAKLADINVEMKNLEERLANLKALGTFDTADESLIKALEIYDKQLQEKLDRADGIMNELNDVLNKKPPTADSLTEASSKFESDMLSSLNAGQRLASTVQSGLFRAGSSFVDYMRDALTVVMQVVGIVKGFSLASIVDIVTGGEKAHFGGTYQGGHKIAKFSNGADFTVPYGFPRDSFHMAVESKERVTVTPANAVGSGDKLLAEINKSINRLNINLVEKDMNPVVIGSFDSDAVIENNLKPAENRLNQSGVNLNDI